MTFSDLPATTGSYVLLLTIDAPAVLDMPRLGKVQLDAGQYAYVGSAHGPGGLRARVGRHLRVDKPLHWHIDYLTAAIRVVHVVALASAARLECTWAKRLLALNGASVPVPGFGSSDCRNRCPAHLIRLPDGLNLAEVEEALLVEHGAEADQRTPARRYRPGLARRHQRRRRRGGRARSADLRGSDGAAAGASPTPGRRRSGSALVGRACFSSRSAVLRPAPSWCHA